MTQCQTLLLLPRWFMKRQLIVSTCIFVILPVALILFSTTPIHIEPSINLLGKVMVLFGMALLYPYSRYAVQWIIDYWYGEERVVYDGSLQATLDRKFMKMMASLILMLLLGPLCILALLVSHWRRHIVMAP